MVVISTKTKHNKTKRKKTWFLVYLGRKKKIQKERICAERFADNMLECLLFPRAMAS